ncbi:MAG TPA: DUF308 domain-containing protein [Nocardiopsis listeri]|uniref:DUF308 domain-containing protein n=1 Tax=Nocardiopsis listeri TaxID=53440 RepID=UPI001D848564|nr:DUF308 domain-containing protein [Nocardiopsis listeri]HJE58385.1 DUF308 domain-containing protein [Nocardiopsis listeri]
MVRYESAGDMLGELSRSWWVVVVRGVAAVIFGLVALIWPGVTTVALAFVFGAFALVDGIALGVAAFRAAPGSRLALVIQSVLGILLGVAALIWPTVAVVALVFVIGAWAIVTGVAEIVTAVRLRAQMTSEWLLIFAGALSVIFGLLLWLWPGLGALAMVAVVGIYAIVFGIALVIAGLRLRSVAGEIAPSEYGEASAEGHDANEPAPRHAAEPEGGDPLADDPTAEGDEHDVSAFDDGYADGYRDGYRGDPAGATEASAHEDETAAPRVGKHRAPKDPPEDTGTP